MSRFPPQQFHGPNFGPRHPGGNGQFPAQFPQRPRGFPRPQHFSNFHHEGARFQGPPHGRGMPPEQFFHRGPRPPYRGRGGRGGRHDRYPMSAHGHGPPHGFEHQEYFEEQFYPQMGDPRSFHVPNNSRGNPNFNKNQKGQQKGGGKKKRNENKAKPQKDINYSHYCDICDKGFQSDAELKGHIAQHVKCKDKDCRFKGHPKVVKLHQKLHHGPGSKKLRWLDTPGDIQKWRNDRKRKFPTAENIAKKGQRAEQQEKQGNVLETKQFGKVRRKTHRGKRNPAKKLENHLKWKARKLAEAQEAAAELAKSEEVPSKRIKTEDGEDRLSSLAQEHSADPTKSNQGPETDQSTPSSKGQLRSSGAADCDPLSLLASVSNVSDDEELTEARGVNPQIEVAPKGSFGALGSLAACYDSDSDQSFTQEKDDTTKEQESTAQRVTTLDEKRSHAEDSPTLPSESRQPIIPAQDGDESCCHDSEMRDESMAYEEQEEERCFGRKDRRRQKKSHSTRGRRGNRRAEQNKGTLLEMLLAPEIRRERNIILQCVRHIVKNNFFQDPPH